MKSVSRINHACMYYPCHDKDKLEDCVFCYCPKYPCEHPDYGKYLDNGIWDCSQCTWIHEKDRVDAIFDFLKGEFL